MGFSDNIFKLTGGICPPSYRITVCGECGVFIEGVTKILDISGDYIVLAIKDVKVKIYGKNLKISSYYEGDISILGNAVKIEKEGVLK